MHHYIRLFSLLLCFLLGSFAPLQAQQLWSYPYGGKPVEKFGGITTLQDGTILLSGHSLEGEVARHLYLVRTNADGDTLWTRRFGVRKFSNSQSTEYLTENNAAQVLLISQWVNAGVTTPVAVLLNATTGDTLWTRVLPNAAQVTGLTTSPDQQFVLSAQVDGHPTLLRLSTTGQLTAPLSVDYSTTEPGFVTSLARGTGGYWLLLRDKEYQYTATKVVFVSDADQRGAEYTGPANTVLLTNLLPVEDGQFVAFGWSKDGGTSAQPYLYKLSATFDLVWRQALQLSNFLLVGRDLKRNTNGEYVLIGTVYTTHHYDYLLARYDTQGTWLGNTPVATLLATGDYPNMRFAVSPVTGDYYIGTDKYSPQAGNLQDLLLLKFAGATVTAATPARPWAGQLYPNPVSGDAALRLTSATALQGTFVLLDAQGRTVRQWPTQPATSRYELLLRGLPAGLYLLHLTDAQGRRVVRKVFVN